MQLNGSPEPIFDFDEERTWFQVMLPIHPNFVQKQPMSLDLKEVIWDIKGIDRLLNNILEKAGNFQAGDIAGNLAGNLAGDVAGDVAEFVLNFDNQAFEIIEKVNRDVAGDIAGGIAGGMATKMIQVLELENIPIDRKEIMTTIGLVYNVKNFTAYIQPMVTLNWLTMTLPNKPTSPKQQYITTLKGRLILKFLNVK